MLIARPGLSRTDRALVERLNRGWTGLTLDDIKACVARANQRGFGGVIVVSQHGPKHELVHELVRLGLVNHLVPAGQARAKATEIAGLIARNGPVAVRQAKKAIAYGSETDLETAMILAIEAYNTTVVTEDRLEGVRAFNEKRKPEFRGR